MPKTSSKPKSEYAIQTVSNALRMLEVFHEEDEMGVSELARTLGLHKNNAFRLLATLELAGYIQQTPSTDQYHLGPRCLELGQAFSRSHTLLKQARPVLERLAHETGETAHLGVLGRGGESGFEVIHLDGVLPEQLMLTGLRVGTRLEAYCTAIGKALLAGEIANRSLGLALPEIDASAPPAPGSLEAELAGARLPRRTETTLDDAVKLVEALRGVQLSGYAVDLEEYAVGVRCAAAPVRDASARVIGALSLSGPSIRLDEERLHGTIAQAVVRAADALSQELGYRGTATADSLG